MTAVSARKLPAALFGFVDFLVRGLGMRGSRRFATLLCRPTLFVGLARTPNTQRVGRNIVRNCRAGSDVSAIPDTNRRDEDRVAADENLVANRGRVFVHAVVVAGDGAGPDVCFGAEFGVADVGKMRNFRAF